MALSKTNKIIILLVIDTAFFLLELIAGSSLPLLKSLVSSDTDRKQVIRSIPLPLSPIPSIWYDTPVQDEYIQRLIDTNS